MRFKKIKSFALLTGGVAIALALSACGGGNFGPVEGGEVDEGPIKIGAVLDITGAGASVGVEQQNVLKMLASQLEDAGGIDGREVKLIIKDNASVEDGAARAATQLIEDEGVSVIIGATRSGTSLAIRPIAESAKVPVISLAAVTAIVDGSDWMFKITQNDSVILEKLLDDMQAKGYKTVALARDATGTGEGIAEFIEKLGSNRGIELIAVEAFEPTATDFTPQAINLRNANADAIVVWGGPPANGLVQAAFAQLDVESAIYQNHAASHPAYFQAAGDAATGTISAMGRFAVVDELPDSDPHKAVIQGFIDDYTQAYGQPPAGHASYAYDGWNVAVDAIKRAGSGDRTAIRDAILETKGLVGITGTYTMSPENRSGLTPDSAILAVVADGRWTLIK